MTTLAKILVIVLGLTVQICGIQVSAAEVSKTTVQNKDGSYISGILIRGQIQSGDARNFAAAVLKEKEVAVLLDSPGGDVREALLISSIVRELAMWTSVRRGMTCASSCFFIYLAGLGRGAQGAEEDGTLIQPPFAGRVGLHRPYLDNPQATSESMGKQRKVMQSISKYLEQSMVPRQLIEKMMSRASTDIYWMTHSDIRELGIWPPEFEELAIRKCEYQPMLQKMAVESGDPEVTAKAGRQMQCAGRLSGYLNKQGTKKLSEGWFPTFDF